MTDAPKDPLADEVAAIREARSQMREKGEELRPEPKRRQRRLAKEELASPAAADPASDILARHARMNGVSTVAQRRGDVGPNGEHVPTATSRALVEVWAHVGTRQDVIALEMGICPVTLRKYYADELDIGKSRANQRVALTLYEKAIAGDNTAMIFWLKSQAKWSERQAGDSEDNPLHIKSQGDELVTLAAKLRAAKIGGDLYPDGAPEPAQIEHKDTIDADYDPVPEVDSDASDLL